MSDFEHTCNTDRDDGECMACGERDCPYGEPLHYHHDGCPSCTRADPGTNTTTQARKRNQNEGMRCNEMGTNNETTAGSNEGGIGEIGLMQSLQEGGSPGPSVSVADLTRELLHHVPWNDLSADPAACARKCREAAEEALEAGTSADSKIMEMHDLAIKERDEALSLAGQRREMYDVAIAQRDAARREMNRQLDAHNFDYAKMRRERDEADAALNAERKRCEKLIAERHDADAARDKAIAARNERVHDSYEVKTLRAQLEQARAAFKVVVEQRDEAVKEKEAIEVACEKQLLELHGKVQELQDEAEHARWERDKAKDALALLATDGDVFVTFKRGDTSLMRRCLRQLLGALDEREQCKPEAPKVDLTRVAREVRESIERSATGSGT